MYFSTPCSSLRTELIDKSVVNCLFHLVPRPLESLNPFLYAIQIQ